VPEPRDTVPVPAPAAPPPDTHDARPAPAHRKPQVTLTLNDVHVLRHQLRIIGWYLGGALSLSIPVSVLIFLFTGPRLHAFLTVALSVAGAGALYGFHISFTVAIDDRRARARLDVSVERLRLHRAHYGIRPKTFVFQRSAVASVAVQGRMLLIERRDGPAAHVEMTESAARKVRAALARYHWIDPPPPRGVPPAAPQPTDRVG
jgi:hypothetical protein